MAESICSQIKGVDMTVRKVPGTALANDTTGEIISTPPAGEHLLRDLLRNWESFLHEQQQLDPWFVWRSCITNSRQFIHLLTATVELGAF
ncbi:MAG: hypothetical protein CM15mP68_1620 [Pseudomonadota bacterium]|nr:MAG: hypothetical protein CM15mP68_1620 [Pseudomonadota bacterium]